MAEKTDKTQDERLCELEANHRSILWTIGILVTIFMGICVWRIAAAYRIEDSVVNLRAEVNQKIEPISMQYLDIKAQLSQIQTDIIWIKQTIK